MPGRPRMTVFAHQFKIDRTIARLSRNDGAYSITTSIWPRSSEFAKKASPMPSQNRGTGPAKLRWGRPADLRAAARESAGRFATPAAEQDSSSTAPVQRDGRCQRAGPAAGPTLNWLGLARRATPGRSRRCPVGPHPRPGRLHGLGPDPARAAPMFGRSPRPYESWPALLRLQEACGEATAPPPRGDGADRVGLLSWTRCIRPWPRPGRRGRPRWWRAGMQRRSRLRFADAQ